MELGWAYAEKVYAAVLGKIIGVYSGRPFEQWTHKAIQDRFGEVDRYVAEEHGVPLIVSDDDISGTFTFYRAMQDAGKGLDVSPEDIGEAWLNYVIENETVFWWGGIGMSAEHTAYLRLKAGHKPPLSGSIALNGPVVAQQIGSQIFIDAWALLCPGDPAQAAELAKRAAVVSHDGEAIYGAQMVAAMEAAAFVESDINKLIDAGLDLIPRDSAIATMIGDLREWREADNDWRKTLARLDAKYGYDKWLGGCHMVPNHAVIMLALLYSEGSFSRALMISNTAGYDTDCNTANVGCIMALRQGLEAFTEPYDWRGPVSDRMVVPTAAGDLCMADAETTALHIANLARTSRGMDPLAPEDAYRFTFPGSTHGFMPHGPEGGLALKGGGGMKAAWTAPSSMERVVWPAPDFGKAAGYKIIGVSQASPGQTLSAAIVAETPCQLRLGVRIEGGEVLGPIAGFAAGEERTIQWTIPSLNEPVWRAGLWLESDAGSVVVKEFSVAGSPCFRLDPAQEQAWVSTMSPMWKFSPSQFCRNEGTGLAVQGTRAWQDYTVSADFHPFLAESFGLAARYQGLRRHVRLLANGRTVRLERVTGEPELLAEWPCPWEVRQTKALALTVKGGTATAHLDGVELGSADIGAGLLGGGAGICIVQGMVMADEIWVKPPA